MNSTLEQVDRDSLDLGLQRVNLFVFTVGAATGEHKSTAVDGQQARQLNALQALMSPGDRAYLTGLVFVPQMFDGGGVLHCLL